MKGHILSVLRSSKTSVSAENLCTDLGLSKPALELEMKELKTLGYGIDSGPGNYRLTDDRDALYPWEFRGREDRTHYYDEVLSTMDIARDMARDGCPHMTVVIADRQTQGRGRLRRTWLSSEGGLYFNMVLRPGIPPNQGYKTNFLASLVLAQILEEKYGIDARVKWPNDVLVHGEKVSGILAELEALGTRIDFINMGIGINVNNDPRPSEQKATSVKRLMDQDVSRRDLLALFLDRFESRLKGIGKEDVISEWKRLTITLNKKVRIVTAQSVSEGIAVDVTDTGALLLEQADGSVKTVVYGDCFLV